MKTVIVLMSTYNGEEYIREQLDSILNQKGVKIKVLVRDDGSTDSTKEILNEYKEVGKIKWYTGKNLKPAKSFLDLMKKAEKGDYYAFADQDDYWEPEKIKTAVKKLEQNASANTPQVYFSNKKIANENLDIMRDESGKKYILSFDSCMVRNIATGCTMVFNRRMLEIVNSYSPDYVSMHDAWMLRICLAVGGNAILDEQAHMLYRQHENQSIGAEGGVMKTIRRRVKSFFNCEHSREKTAQELLRGYEKQIKPENLITIKELANYRRSFSARRKIIFSKKYKTESSEKNFVFKMAILMGKV